MSGSSPTYNYPAQPTYGEGMADAMKAQMEMLTGKTLAKDEGFEELYASALGKEGGNLADIMRKFEAPLRKETAQIDTDVMRQTLLGGSQKVVKDPETGKYGIPGGEIVTSEQTGSDAPTQTAGGRYQIIMTDRGHTAKLSRNFFDKENMPQYAVIDTDTGGLLDVPQTEWIEKDSGGAFAPKQTNPGVNLKAVTERFNELNGKVAAGVAEGIPESEVKLEFEFTNPNTGKPLQEGDVIREGTGMVDLMGDKRGVQESVQNEDYAKYVRDNPDLQVAFATELQQGGKRHIEEFGRDHYETIGKDEGRELPMGEYTLQDAGRQAGFDESGEFRGLSALAEDIGRGGQQRAREADIADVERLGGRATDAYRAQGDLSGALAQARGIGAGGEKGLSAIPKDPLFEGAALNSLAARTAAENKGIDAITSGGMTYAKADPAADLTADTSYKASTPAAIDPLSATTSYTPTAGISGGVYGGELGTYDPNANSTLGGPAQYPQPTLRSNLLADAKTSLTGGLTPREERQISEAMKAQSTMMGRTFDQSAGIAEAKARTLEDRNRQALNRQYAQQVPPKKAFKPNWRTRRTANKRQALT